MRNLRFTDLLKLFFYSLPIIFIMGAMFSVLGFVLGFITLPVDFLQGFPFTIIFVHVPAGWICTFLYVLMTALALLFIIFDYDPFVHVSSYFARVAFLYTSLTLITGALWGIKTWGAYFVADARSSFVWVLFFILLGLLLFDMIMDVRPESNYYRQYCYLIILGFVTIPLIKYSVDWWNTMHQASSISITSVHSMHVSVYLPLVCFVLVVLVMALGFVFILVYDKYLYYRNTPYNRR